jgi:hypothetical protein
VQAEHGARTIIGNEMTPAHAYECMSAFASAGIEAFCHDDVAAVNMKALLKSRKMATKKALSENQKALDNLVHFDKGRKNDGRRAIRGERS